MDGSPDMSESSSSGLRLAMRHARSMFPGFRRPTGDDEQEPGSNDDASKLPWRRPDNARSTSESTARRVSSQGSDAMPDKPDILLTRNDSSASRHSRASSGASTGPLSRKSSLQRSLQSSPLQEIPEPVNEAVVTPAAPASAPVPPPPPPPPPELPNDKRALFLRARTKSIDHMHRFLHIRQFTKENKGKSKKKKQEGDTLAVPDPGPIEAPPISPRPMAVPPTPAPMSPLTDAVITPASHTSHREASPPTVAPPVIIPISVPAPGALETSAPLPPLPPLPPPSPPSPPADAEAPGPDNVHESEREARPIPPLPPRPSPPVDDSPAKPVSMRSMASGDTQTSLTSLVTATDTMDRSFATPDRVRLRSSSQSTSLAWDADPASLSSTQAGEASIGALALLPDDEGQATPMPPVDDMLVRPIDTPVLLSDEPRSLSPTWPGWPMESVASASQSQSDAQGLLENLGLDDLDAGSAPPSASSMYSDVSVERIEAAQPDVPSTAPTPPKVRGMATMPNDDIMPVRAPPAHAVPSSESEPDSATSAPPPWVQRFKGRGPAAASETSSSASTGMGLAIDTSGPSLPSPPAHRTSEEDQSPRQPLEDDVMRSARPPLRTSKSSSLLTAMTQQAQRIRRNVRDAGASMGDDDDDDETNAARGKGRQASRRSESTEPLPIASPSSAVDLPALQKEAPSKSETPVSMYRTRRNKSQPTLRIADDLEFLHALEQVRLQHKERLAVRQRARSARKASMPNLRPPPSSRQPPLPMTRVVSDRGTVESGVMGRPRASSLADRADESLMVSHPPETLDVRSMTPDASTSFLELESVASDESEESEESAALEAASVHASSEESEAISNELGIGHTTGNFPSAPFTNDDDWKKEVKALFLIRELVQTERSYAAHLESLLIVVLKWTGTTSSTRLPTNVLMPTQPSSSSQSLRMPTPTTPAHLVTLRQMLPKLISVSRALVYSIEESPTSEGVARSFLSMLGRFEDVHVSWHGVVGATLRSLRAAESSKSKAKGRLGRVPIAPPTTEPPRRLARADTSSSDPSEPERRDKTRSEPKELSAVDVAIMPTQRIPRYVLLLRDLLSYTSADSEAYTTLEAALRAVQDLGHRCDQASGST
ncbi:hypothetical protein MEQU1_002653 [Malassezia equina]|uniref:DH domain-containing protein n=1 Tax=Malassezia equina TaxID=1381935 RepID=A0AAF0EGB5_9BASI|nr:hypothetical protein MEQU1_002653 [Malassezia equina]